MCGNFSLNVSFMSFLRSDGLTYSITVVWRRKDERRRCDKRNQNERRGERRSLLSSVYAKQNHLEVKQWSLNGNEAHEETGRAESRLLFTTDCVTEHTPSVTSVRMLVLNPPSQVWMNYYRSCFKCGTVVTSNVTCLLCLFVFVMRTAAAVTLQFPFRDQ